jgi:hypothetical protein
MGPRAEHGERICARRIQTVRFRVLHCRNGGPLPLFGGAGASASKIGGLHQPRDTTTGRILGRFRLIAIVIECAVTRGRCGPIRFIQRCREIGGNLPGEVESDLSGVLGPLYRSRSSIRGVLGRAEHACRHKKVAPKSAQRRPGLVLRLQVTASPLELKLDPLCSALAVLDLLPLGIALPSSMGMVLRTRKLGMLCLLFFSARQKNDHFKITKNDLNPSPPSQRNSKPVRAPGARFPKPTSRCAWSPTVATPWSCATPTAD